MVQDVKETPSLGTGAYTIPEAAQLLKSTVRQVRGWVDGYTYRKKSGPARSKSILGADNRERSLLTFRDLVELFFVGRFRSVGVSLPDIRYAADLLRREWKTPCPFARGDIYSDGKQLLLERNGQYTNIVRHQEVFGYAEEFFRNIDVDPKTQLAEKWWPLGKDKLIVLDRTRSYGAPIEVRTGIRTDVLYRAYKTMGGIEAVADWYEVPSQAVEQAIEFEENWKAAA
jgi:uncharacterized protein (DUF433 family)